VAILAGVIPAVVCFLLIPLIARLSKHNTGETETIENTAAK
jgi:hypothetical protein